MSSSERPSSLSGSDLWGSGRLPKSLAPQASSDATSDLFQSSSPPSTSFSANVPETGASTLRKNTAGHAMWPTLKVSMKFLHKGCKACPHLESAVGALREVIDAVNTTKQGDKELRSMASDLPEWALILSAYMSDSQPKRMTEWIDKLMKDLVEQTEYIRTQQQHGKIGRLVGSKEEIEELRRFYRRIETSFRQLQADTALSTWRLVDDQSKESRLNLLSPIHDARYDSSFSNKIERGACFQNTRVSVLERIRDWLYGDSDVKIYWTNGMDGTGKTTIAYSICAELERLGQLGASFFCSRASSECQDVSRILPTIAYQLAQRSYPFRSSLCKILDKANIGQHNISVQFEHLIKDPMSEVKDMLPNGLVVVIDAPDECSNPRTVEMILDALLYSVTDLPIRFFITSRPEPSLTNTLIARDNESHSVLRLHNVDEQVVKDDIETYLATMLARLSLSGDQIKQLADRAGVLFISAATIARYLLAAGRGAHVSTRLITVLSGDGTRENKNDREIDRLYKCILAAVLGDEQLKEDEVELIKQVLWTVVCVREPVARGTLAALLNVDNEQVSAALKPLQSVLHVSEGSEVVSTLHASFSDFMLSSKRSGSLLSCKEAAHSEYLARRCFELMEEQLKFNICGLETSYRFDQDIPNLEDRVKAAISPELFYVCRYWAQHLRLTSISSELLTFLDQFLHERLLFWMEVLNLKGCIGAGPQILAEAQKWLLKGDGVSDTRAFVRDACKFADTFASNPVRRSTPHIYESVLPFVARQSMVWENYWRRTQGLLLVDGTLINPLEGTLQAKCQVSYGVGPILNPLDDTRIISGFSNHTISDACATNLLGSLSKGHPGAVTSVAISPDGTCIISGSRDRTIRVWDMRGGTPLGGPFKGHDDWVSSVAFSPDGTRIVSGSLDCTIRVWDMHTLSSSGPSYGHINEVLSVAFSPDGTTIVSGSRDHTVRLWDGYTGSPMSKPFKGHAGAVSSVAFSPDGTEVVSGSSDCTVRVWKLHSGSLTSSRTFQGHANGVLCVAFSPDGARIVSGSRDHTIRMWDAHSGDSIGSPLKGHTNGVWSVAFSPDGTLLYSGSWDCTIRTWDVCSGNPLGCPFNGHTDAVWSIAVSPDGSHIVSGSNDCTIRIWATTLKPHPQTPIPSMSGPDNQGWIINPTSRAPLLWLPAELCNIFPWPPNTLTISHKGCIESNFENIVWGERWDQCYKLSNLEV